MFRFICGRGGAGESSVPPCQTKVPVPPQKRTKTDPSVLSRDHGPACRKKGQGIRQQCRIPSIPGFVLLFFCEKDTAGERRSAYSVIRNGIAFRLCLLLLYYF